MGVRYTQPQSPALLDTNNPIGSAVDYFFTPTYQGDGRGIVASSPIGGVSTVYSKYGLGAKTNGTTGYFSGPSSITIKGTGAYTRFAVLRIGSGGSTRAILSSGGSGGEMWRIANNTDVVFVKTNLNVEYTQAGIVSANEYCVLVSVNDAGGSNNLYTYKNGVLVATTAGVTAGAAGTVSVGQSGIASSFGDHEFYLVGSVNRALSAAEVASFSANPWQIFKASPRRLLVGGVGGGVSLAITGQSLTANLGALSASVTSSVTGNQTSLQQGTIKASVSQTLTGKSVSLAQGSILSDVSTGITGQQVLVAQGFVTNANSSDVTKAITGQELTNSLGTLIPSVQYSLSGLGVTSSLGNLTADVSYTLSGQGIPISLGTIAASVNSALVGQEVSLTLGSISASISTVLNGQTLVLAQSPLSPVVTSSISGQNITTALGTINSTGGTNPQYSKNSNLYYNIGNDLSIMLGSPTLPTWNNSGRPAVGKLGLFGFNTETGKLEVYNGSTWVSILLT
jgi:hypothetical protein